MKPTLTPFPRMSRRGFGKGMLGVAGIAGLGGALAACGTPAAHQDELAAEDISETDKRVMWSQWPEYIDEDEDGNSIPTLDRFKEQTGIEVTYTPDINDNEQFFAKISPALRAGQDTGRDLFVVTDWMIARMIRLGWIQQLNYDNLPNAAANLEPALKAASADPQRKYSLPWQTGATVIGWNPKSTGGKEVTSMEQLLTDPALKGKVSLLLEWRDTVGNLMPEMDISPESFTEEEFRTVLAFIQEAKDRGQITRFTGQDYTGDLTKGELAASLAWSGDIYYLLPDNPDLQYYFPDAGYQLWSDSMAIPNMAQRKTNAEKLMDFYYDPENMADVTEWVAYIPPLNGVDKVLEERDSDLAESELVFPSEELLSRGQSFMAVSAEEEELYNNLWAEIVTG